MDTIQAVLDDDEILTNLARRIFEAFDDDRSGIITQTEIKEKLGKGEDIKFNINEAMKYLDIDGTGSIDLDELKEFIRFRLKALISY